MSKLIDAQAMLERVRKLYERGMVDLSYYNIVKEAVQMESDAREARLMSLEEALGAEINVDACWLEIKADRNHFTYLADAVITDDLRFADITIFGGQTAKYPLSCYGTMWRMWKGKPTDEQLKSTMWSEEAIDGG